MLSAEVALQDRLGTGGVSLLGIDTRSRHMRDHSVPASEWVLGVAERMVLWCWLREPDVAAVAAEVTGCEGVGDILL